MEKEHKSKKDEKKQKRNKWILPIILGIVLIIGIFIIVSSKNSKTTGNVVNSENEDATKSCKDIQVPYDYLEEYQETVPYSDRECESKNLVYSATNEKWDYSTCNQQSEVCYEKHWYGDSDCHTFCSDKSLSYSVDINNLDEEQGSWVVNIYFYKQNNLYKTVPITQFLYPKTTKTCTGAFRVTGDSPAGDANQEYSAGYNIQSIPSKQVCRDVTKYQEVTKTRTVTRYRTEQKCE